MAWVLIETVLTISLLGIVVCRGSWQWFFTGACIFGWSHWLWLLAYTRLLVAEAPFESVLEMLYNRIKVVSLTATGTIVWPDKSDFVTVVQQILTVLLAMIGGGFFVYLRFLRARQFHRQGVIVAVNRVRAFGLGWMTAGTLLGGIAAGLTILTFGVVRLGQAATVIAAIFLVLGAFIGLVIDVRDRRREEPRSPETRSHKFGR